jgi:hypothetical protein
LKGEDDREKQDKGRRTCGNGSSNNGNICNDNSAVILIFQHLPGERVMFDRNNLVMEPDNLYHNMKEFKLIMK